MNDIGAPHIDVCHSTRTPTLYEDKRTYLFKAVGEIAHVLEIEIAPSEELRHLTSNTLAAIRQAGLHKLKAPECLGGFEADNALQFEVIERVAYHNPAVAWCLFIYADTVGKVTANIDEKYLSNFVDGNDFALVCGGGGFILGKIVRVPDGYMLSGKWVYGSGIRGSDYVLVLAEEPDAEAGCPPRACIVPTKEFSIADNWHVLGLKGTGSSDFALKETFVPEGMTFALNRANLRGGAIYQLGFAGYVSHMTPAMMAGATRRALDELVKIAETKARGYTKKAALIRREVFQDFIGRSYLELSAIRAAMVEVGRRIVRDAEALGSNPIATEAEIRAASALAAEKCVAIVSGVSAYAGGTGAQAGSVIERIVRDLHMAKTHYLASNAAIDAYGRSCLGFDLAQEEI